MVGNFSYTSRTVPMFTPKYIMETQNNIAIPLIRLMKLYLICQVTCTMPHVQLTLYRYSIYGVNFEEEKNIDIIFI